jgi:hypothetical protein
MIQALKRSLEHETGCVRFRMAADLRKPSMQTGCGSGLIKSTTLKKKTGKPSGLPVSFWRSVLLKLRN